MPTMPYTCGHRLEYSEDAAVYLKVCTLCLLEGRAVLSSGVLMRADDDPPTEKRDVVSAPSER